MTGQQLGEMFDSTTAADIPAGAVMVGAYLRPSRYQWSAADRARFPYARFVNITPSASVYGTEDGFPVHVLDVENGDATADQVPGWVTNSRAAGQEPTVYTFLANWAAVIRAIDAAHLAHPPYWIASWNNTRDLPSITVNGVTHTATAHQYAGSATSGGHYDRSCVAPYWPGVDPAPTPAPATEEDMGFSVQVSGTGDGTVQSVQVPAAGMKYINFATGFGNTLTIKQALCYGATPADPAPAAMALTPVHADGEDWVIDNDRPGPVPLPDGVRTVSVEFTCNGNATIYTSLA